MRNLNNFNYYLFIIRGFRSRKKNDKKIYERFGDKILIQSAHFLVFDNSVDGSKRHLLDFDEQRCMYMLYMKTLQRKQRVMNWKR